jgi:exocyst complex component 4
LHNNVLSSLGSAQNGVSAARRRLRDAREALGAKRADLVQMWQRSQVVKDSLRLLDTIENIKGVPDRLESLMSEKRFLEAVNLLTRSLKVVEKPDIREVGASADLRAYLKGQEQAMFDILVEELHNHLYLKSYFCDTRWKQYSPGQTSIPNVNFGKEYEEVKVDNGNRPEEDALDQGREMGISEELKLFKYLKSLANRPSFDPDLATDMPGLAGPDPYGATDMRRDMSAMGIPNLQSTESNTALAANGTDSADQFADQSPESDSFLYIEMLLESLARLGKLKLTQEIIHQRLTIELHQLVDSTIDEVDSRNELLRRSSVMVMRPESLLLSNSSALARSFADSTRNSFRSSSYGRRSTLFGTSLGSTSMRLSTQESNKMERDNETMRDLFWTLFSKLDAVLQGHRVVFEVVTKISSRGASSAYKAVKIGKPASLIEIWKPIQAEVRTLLYEHLVDDAESTSARRNVLVSVNEVLRQGSFQRDRSKPLFKLVADSAPRPGINLSRKDFAPLRRHEEALTNALRSSVPGLVGAMDSGSGANGASVSIANFQTSSLRSVDASFPNAGGHKLLIKPDAFNISVLFRPALAFIERVKVLLPAEASGESDSDVSSSSGKGFSRFLDEFVKDVFLNQLEDKVHGLLMTAVGGPDAFQEDGTSRGLASIRPIVRSASNVIVLIDSLYSMLRTTPFHRRSYSHLIIQTIVQYYQQCHEKFRDLVTNDVTAGGATTSADAGTLSSFVISATWAQSPMIATCLVEAVQPQCSASRRKQLFDLENSLELGMAAKPASLASKGNVRGTVALPDLTTSRKKLSALCNLQNSLVWFFEHIQKLKATDEDVTTSPNAVARLSLIGQVKPGLSAENGDGGDVEEELKLPMNKDMAVRFQTLPKTFQHLSHIVLFTLRIEIRARTIHYLDLAINEGNYVIEDAVLEPDPQIVDLNAELASLDDIFADSLLPQHHR